MLPIQVRPLPQSQKVSVLVSNGLHPVVAQCLVQRGVEDPTIALMKQKLLPYKGLKGIGEMAVGLAQAIKNKEKMVVVADYDCDGATACAVAVSGLRALGADIDFVVPNRMVHGYGLTPSVVELAAQKNPRWIVTVDNGIASVDGVNAANARGIGVWVTDHHLPGDVLPQAAGIVNPNQPGCPFPSKNLAGVGVMFYVFAATRDVLKASGDQRAAAVNVSDWLDIVALGTVADVVKLDENNRWLVHQGLLRIREGNMHVGIAALFEVSRRDYSRACAQDFGFGLGPRLNAAGRLEDMSIGIRCLLSDDWDEALKLAQELDVLNERRKDIEKEMKETAWAQLEAEKQRHQFTRVVFGHDFHEGVIGIVAGRIKEQEYSPTIVFAPMEGGGWKGSGRSIPGLHLRDVIDMVYKKHPTWFVKFGGHAMAAGLSLTAEGYDGFAQEFEEAVKTWFNNQKPEQVLLTDGALPSPQLNLETAKHISSHVWGQGFEEPLWMGDFVVQDVSMIGKDKNHLKMMVTPLDSNQKFTALHFFQEGTELPYEGQIIKLAYRLQGSVFREEEKLDLIVVDR